MITFSNFAEDTSCCHLGDLVFYGERNVEGCCKVVRYIPKI
jgi:hypothetical protein